VRQRRREHASAISCDKCAGLGRHACAGFKGRAGRRREPRLQREKAGAGNLEKAKGRRAQPGRTKHEKFIDRKSRARSTRCPAETPAIIVDREFFHPFTCRAALVM
jgi:hypothetical protein